jgi:hypothetical protein
MRPIDHFLSQLDRLESTRRSGGGLDEKLIQRLSQDFTVLAAPVIGESAAAELFEEALDRMESSTAESSLAKFGALAAFLLGEYDDETMELNDDDWSDIRETLEELSGEMDMDTLTALMGDLLARGKLR